LCSKGAALAKTLDASGRLLYPEISGARAGWDEALDLIAGTFCRTIDEHGPDAVALYVSGQFLTEDYYVANKLTASILGNNAGGGGLPRAAEDRRPDAALLLVPLMDFPVSSSAIVDTVRQIEAQLRSGDFVHRYVAEDGLAGGEGAFLLCSFWLVDALLTLDREPEARDLFERLLARANDVGLYSEEIDTKTGDFLGNFPQALTHLGLIGSAVNLRLYETGGAAAVRGTYADRAARSVGASFGWRGILSAFRHSGTLPFRSSRASKLRLGEGIKRSPL
jgi:GH15 family glucan-1,4-alpha-glucosidase